MTNWKSVHRQRLFDLLTTLSTSRYWNKLWFKWGTALYFFYQLPRFSVDLDFDLIAVEAPSVFKDILLSFLQPFVLKKWGTIKPEWTLENSFRFIVQYGGVKKLKLEFSYTSYPNVYEQRLLLWVPVLTMDIRRMFAHKMAAFIARRQQRGFLANRDLFDMHFLFWLGVHPSEEIVRMRSLQLTGKELSLSQWYSYLIAFIMEHKPELEKNILDGVGELIDEQQKIFVKNALLTEIVRFLELQRMA